MVVTDTDNGLPFLSPQGQFNGLHHFPEKEGCTILPPKTKQNAHFKITMFQLLQCLFRQAIPSLLAPFQHCKDVAVDVFDHTPYSECA